MLVVRRGDDGDGGEIASTRLEDALPEASAAAVVADRFLLVGNKRRGGMGNTPRSTRKAAAVESKRFQQSNIMLYHYIGRVREGIW